MKHTAWITFALALAGAATCAAQEQLLDYFPLPTGMTWSYSVTVTQNGEEAKISAVRTVLRREDVDGKECAVVERRSGGRVLDVKWFQTDGQQIRQVRNESNGVTHDMRAAAADRSPLADGRIVLGGELPRLRDKANPLTWLWTTVQGDYSGEVRTEGSVTLKLPNLGRLQCLVIYERAEFKAGERTISVTRRVWLAPGLGPVKEVNELRTPDGASQKTVFVLTNFPKRS